MFSDPLRNRRNDPGHRAAFRAQGEYFRRFDDAGSVADPAELLAAWRAIEDSGRQVVAPFHSHRRRLSTAHIRRHHGAVGADAGGLTAVLAGARGGAGGG